ncbi:MAG: isochorismate synthase [Planctomycetes bacterium]|nr:isochorismate synthase [Planctomycetota bacterium]
MDMLPAARSVCEDALALARLQRDGRAWAVLAWPSALEANPIAAFTAARGRRRTLLWNEGEWMLGVGDAAAVASDGPGRTAHLTAAAARLDCRCAIAVHGGDATIAAQLPCLFTALSFEDHAPGPSHWGNGLSGARMWLPRRLLWRRADGSGWIVAALGLTGGDQSPGRLAERLIADPTPVMAGMPATWPSLKTDYQERVEDVVSLIRDGAMRKVVLARAVDETLSSSVDEASVLTRLHAQGGAETTVYAHDVDDGSLFVGASPELLFSAEGNRVVAMALAGSSPRATDPAEDQRLIDALMASTKERKEHGVVVEHLVSILRPRCHGFAIPPAPHPRLLNRLLHLETLLEADLRQPDYLELLQALHPTPAVCGLPTPTAANYIARHEHLHRGLYTGALGWTTPQSCRFIVPLRGAILRDASMTADKRAGIARLFAGAGIVETSDPAAEFAETELKFEIMRSALQ